MIKLNVRGYDESPDCAGCPCAKNGKPQKAVPGFGGTGGLCIVGEAPGREEVTQGFPFLGPSGKIVNKGLRMAGADRSYVFITNALLCPRPASDEAFDVAVACCRPRLQADLALAEPRAICALGGTAMRALQLDVTAVSQARGTVQFSPLAPQVPVVGALHPAFLLHGGAGEMTSGGKQKMNVDAQALFLYSDMLKAHGIAEGKVDPVWRDDIQVVYEAAEVVPAVKALLADIYEWGMLGLDLEWTCDGSKNALDALGADAHRAQITWVGIACEKWGISFKWEALVADHDARGSEFPEGAGGCESGLSLLQAAMLDETLPKLMHNKQADIAVWEAQVGPMRGRRLDTMLAHHAVCPGIDHDLQQVVSQYLCVPPWKVDHARQIAAHEARMKEEAKVAKALEREAEKARKKAVHEAANAKKKAEAAERKAKRQAEHEAKNAAAAAGGKKARKKAKPVADVLPGRLSLFERRESSMADEIVGDIVDPPGPGPEHEDGDPCPYDDDGLVF
jgi:DNA polymerase